ncbi:ABC transporter permease [Methylocella sp. CPCC 101449]|uniref:ABC transporter permease n=1 Tax=Methylocella sp. CPCC 101449 TaxID=2987531 RepID=UPI002890296F|nr:ABC transporter permease [Methylocella sp. CPCC 101449]MDT2019483.1 ABC transporter permease [Methylocella sp. CPCC 101449]
MTDVIQKPAAKAAGGSGFSFSIGAGNVDRLMNIASPVFLLLLWEVAARMGWIDVRFFPAPSKIFQTMFTLIENGQLWIHLKASMYRLFWGFLLGGIPALVLGISMGLSRTLRAICDPLVAATYPIPKSAILPLILLIFGLGEASKIVMVGIGLFYPILINTVAGVLEIPKIHFDVSKNFGASKLQVFRTVALPGALPLIMTGVKLGVGMGLILISLSEMVGAKSGLGYMMWNAWEILSVETMYVGLIVIAALGVLFSLILNEVERYLVPWKAAR